MTTILWLRSTVKGREGNWYHKTLEYGFWSKLDTQCYLDNRRAKEFHKRETRDRTYKDMYACGWLPPHYPMPVVK